MTAHLRTPWERSDGAFVIAEIGVNHNGRLDLALQLIDVAADAGADAVKFQTFKTDKLASENAPKAEYQNREDPGSGSQAEMLRRLELSAEDYTAIAERAKERGILFMATPFDEDSADFLEGFGVELFKVSSGDLTHVDLLAHLARKCLPIIISTGMADMSEVEDAVRTIEAHGNPPLAILHCVSNYPADPSEANLRAIDTLAAAFGRTTGWSDHMHGSAITLAAVARGARIIEKHFTLDRNLPGPDHSASLEPDELKSYVAEIRMIESALGSGRKAPTEAEKGVAAVARRSLAAARAVEPGEVLTEDMLIALRPSTGIAPIRKPEVLGRRTTRALAKGETLQWSDIGA